MSQNPEEVADSSRNRKRYAYVARKQKRRAAKWDRHGRAQKSSERNRKRNKEQSDEAIQKSVLERNVYASVVFDPEAHLVQEQSKVRSISMICFVIVHLVSLGNNNVRNSNCY